MVRHPSCFRIILFHLTLLFIGRNSLSFTILGFIFPRVTIEHRVIRALCWIVTLYSCSSVIFGGFVAEISVFYRAIHLLLSSIRTWFKTLFLKIMWFSLSTRHFTWNTLFLRLRFSSLWSFQNFIGFLRRSFYRFSNFGLSSLFSWPWNLAETLLDFYN